MKNSQIINKLCDCFIEQKKLTTKSLNHYGLTSEDISYLLSIDLLQKINTDLYSFQSFHTLFCYGKQLISLKQFDKAAMCFEKCYQLDPNHIDTCVQLFYQSIMSQDYTKSFQYLDHLYNSDDKMYQQDAKLYLYLLNIITDIPQKYRESVRKYTLNDIMVDLYDTRYFSLYAQTRIRISAFYQRFTLAARKLNECIKQQDKTSIYDLILQTLLYQATKKQSYLRNKILKLTKQKKYTEVISHLEKTQKIHTLDNMDEATLLLAKEICNFKKTGIIPYKQLNFSNKLFEVIHYKDFSRAFFLSTDYIKKYQINSNQNILFLLLKDINELMGLQNHRNQPFKDIVVDEDNQHKKMISSESPITYDTVIDYFMKQDLDRGFSALKIYLYNINQSDYGFLIVSLIKIGVIQNDMSFEKAMNVFHQVCKNNYIFDVSDYVQYFYQSIEKQQLEEANIYFDIISKAYRLDQECLFIEDLEKLLHSTKNNVNCKENDFKWDIEKISKLKSSDDDSEKNLVSECEFIEKQLPELYDKGIVLLKPMDYEKRKNIHHAVKQIPDIVSFDIVPFMGESKEKKQVVLRFKPYQEEILNFSEIARIGNSAYASHDYDLCIEKYTTLLQFGQPKSWVYGKLGLAYMKKFEKKTAISFLKIATALSKEEKSDYDFTDLLISLTGVIAKEDQKPKVKMNTNDFYNDTKDYYGIENFDKLFELIHSGKSIDEASIILGYTKEQKEIATLVLARDCYMKKNYVTGDQYLKEVDKEKNKTKFVKSLIDEVRKNKKFYKYRVNDHH